MTQKDKVMAAIAAAGDALEKMFPDVQFRITAEGEDKPEAEVKTDSKKQKPLDELLDMLGIKMPEALRTPAAHVEMIRNGDGELTSAHASPAATASVKDQLDEMTNQAIDKAVKAIFAEQNDEPKECVCIHCPDCDGCDGCDEDEEDDLVVIPDSECSMVNVHFGNNLEDICVSRCGCASETKMAAALLMAALDVMPDWPDEKWQNFLDLLEELAWMLERVEEE